jgi:hypothetical protein
MFRIPVRLLLSYGAKSRPDYQVVTEHRMTVSDPAHVIMMRYHVKN